MLIPRQAQARMSHEGWGANTRIRKNRNRAGLVNRNASFLPLVSASLLIGRAKTIYERVEAVLRRPRVRVSAPLISAA